MRVGWHRLLLWMAGTTLSAGIASAQQHTYANPLDIELRPKPWRRLPSL